MEVLEQEIDIDVDDLPDCDDLALVADDNDGSILAPPMVPPAEPPVPEAMKLTIALEQCIAIASKAGEPALLSMLQHKLHVALKRKAVASSSEVKHLQAVAVERRRKDADERQAELDKAAEAKAKVDLSKADLCKAQEAKDKARIEALAAARVEREALIAAQKAEQQARQEKAQVTMHCAELVAKVHLHWTRTRSDAQKAALAAAAHAARMAGKGTGFCRLPDSFFEVEAKCLQFVVSTHVRMCIPT